MLCANITLTVLRIILLSELLFSLNSCGIKVIYNNLDFLVPFWVDDYITLNNAQEKVFQQRLEEMLAWHRKNEMPAYAYLIKQVRHDIKTGLTPSLLEQRISSFEDHWQLMSGKIAALTAEILYDASTEQKREVLNNLAKKTAILAQKFAGQDKTARKEKIAELMQDRISDWFDTLSDAQKNVILAAAAKLDQTYNERLAIRENIHARLRQVLDSNADKNDLRLQLTELFLNQQNYYPAGYHEKLCHNRGILIAMIIRLIELSTPEQIAYLNSRLDTFANSFEQLAGIDAGATAEGDTGIRPLAWVQLRQQVPGQTLR